VSKPSTREAAEGPAQGPVRVWLTRSLALAAAVGLTLGSYRYPENAILPTLAFFTWAYLFARTAIALPGQLGVFPHLQDDDDPELDPGPDRLDPASDPSAIYRIDD
jgi:hypothetical protein